MAKLQQNFAFSMLNLKLMPFAVWEIAILLNYFVY